MKRWLPATLLAGLTVVSACSRQSDATVRAPAADAGVITLDDAAQQHAGITVASVATTLRAQTTEAPGILALDERVTARIGSLVDGIVLDAPADVGDRVRAGQVLATMHSVVVHDAWASYRKAIAERRRQEKELAFAVAAHERTQRLYADKAISLQEVQRAEADRVAAEEALDMARTEVRLEHRSMLSATSRRSGRWSRSTSRCSLMSASDSRCRCVSPPTPAMHFQAWSRWWATPSIPRPGA